MERNMKGTPRSGWLCLGGDICQAIRLTAPHSVRKRDQNLQGILVFLASLDAFFIAAEAVL
jgi:hypothetical protein